MPDDTTTIDAPPGTRRWLVITLGVLIVAALAWLAWSYFGDGDEFADEAEAAADWVVAEFDEPTPSWADFGPGVYADIVLGLTAVGGADETADAALDRLAAESAAVLGEPGAALAGSLGKVLLAVEARGEDPATFVEGRDIEAELRGMLDAGGQFAGASVYDQALGILALAATDDGVPEAAGEWLASVQCEPGDFQYAGTCPAPDGGEDPDTTAVALQALLAAGQDDAAAATTGWLLAWQGDDGSINSFGTANANSTAVAAQALRAAGEGEAADRAATFVAGLQVDDPAGAIKFAAADPEPNAFATIQGMLAFGAAPLDEIETRGGSPQLAAAR